ncbi:acetyltransferase (GNAT) family domain-containing protein [Ditylenchus destructor]|nr:acetyltransferase (GNAT) family domain-containing protein [Ditylenchus destructor]
MFKLSSNWTALSTLNATNELDLVIRELPKGITEESLRTYFSRYGQLRHCEVIEGTYTHTGITHASFMPKKPKVGGYVFNVTPDAERIFRQNGTKNSIINEGFLFCDGNAKTGNEAYPRKWKCIQRNCPATLCVTKDWESDHVGQFRRGVVRYKQHGTGPKPHRKPKLDSDKAGDVAEDDEPDVAANVPEAEDDEELAAELTALDLEEPEPAEDQPSTSRASAPPQEPTMRALSSEADIAAAIALAAAVLPDLPHHMRDSVIESATKPHSTAFAHGHFGARGQLVGLIIGLKNHWTALMKMNISPLSEERRLAGANSYRTAYIALLAVDPKHRKQGIGKALLRKQGAEVQKAPEARRTMSLKTPSSSSAAWKAEVQAKAAPRNGPPDRRPSRASRAQSPSYVTRALAAPTFSSEMAAVLNLFRARDSSPGCAFYRGFSLLRAQLWFQPLRCPSSTEPLAVFVLLPVYNNMSWHSNFCVARG